MKPCKIFVVGSFVTGVTVVLPRQPMPGETLVGAHFDLGIGGKGNNQAMAANNLGAETNVIMKIGDDEFGKMLLREYNERNISTKNIIIEKGAQSGIGLVYLQEDGENTIGLFKGANELLSEEDVLNVERDIADSDILMLQLEVPDKAIIAATKIAKKNGVKVLLNPSPVRELAPELINKIDILVLNLGEAGMILNETISSNFEISDIEILAKKLYMLGPKVIVITLGSMGAFLYTVEKSIFQKSFKINAVDTVGSGDSFTGALAVALAEEKSYEEALLLASANGAYTATKYGVGNALPTKEEIKEFISSHKF